jgi:hypothetical protein
MQQAPRLLRYGPMPSHVIRRFMYVSDTRELTVEFVSGRRYVYSQVPADDVAAFGSAFAKGSHFNRHIRDRFPCRELAPAEES